LDFVVEVHQKWTFGKIVAHLGGFFFGGAERQPDVFRGRKRIMGSLRLRLFGF